MKFYEVLFCKTATRSRNTCSSGGKMWKRLIKMSAVRSKVSLKNRINEGKKEKERERFESMM